MKQNKELTNYVCHGGPFFLLLILKLDGLRLYTFRMLLGKRILAFQEVCNMTSGTTKRTRQCWC